MPAVPSQRMILARHATPTGDIQLQQRPLADGRLAFEMIVNGVFLMASYNQGSERALARYALDALVPQSDLRVLVGGLGMGFSLQETLSSEDVAAVDVVEINPHIVEWNRTHFASLNGGVLNDARVTVIQEDVCTVLQTPPQIDQYHAVMLDVDNGPSWLAHENNAYLYTSEALHRWAARMAPSGCLTVWSAQSEPDFLERLCGVFGQAEELIVQATGEKDPVEQFVYRAIAPS